MPPWRRVSKLKGWERNRKFLIKFWRTGGIGMWLFFAFTQPLCIETQAVGFACGYHRQKVNKHLASV